MLEALVRGRVCVFSVEVCVCARTGVVSDNAYPNRPPLHPLPCSLSVSTTVQPERHLEANLLKCVFPTIFRSYGISLYFSVFLQPLLNVIGAFTAIC